MPVALIPFIALTLKYLVVRLLIAFGVASVTYAGYSVAMGTFKDYIVQNMQSMPVDILNLLLIAGFGQGLGYIFGAFAFKIAMTTINKITMLVPAGGKS
jgi:cell division protein FtsX